jgi:DNA polymerase
MGKQEDLAKIKKRLEADENLPLRETANNIVFGEGNPDAKLYFLGEAPGKFEDLTGRPFVGQAGKLLEKLLNGIGIKREDVYISNIVRFRPPNNRPPHPYEIEAFAQSVVDEISVVNPKVVITLGRFPMGKFLQNETISNAHGKIYDITWHGKNIHLLPFFHPAAALRSGKFKQLLEEDFKKLPKILKTLTK